jgi:predicted nucleic acid-binding protein
VVTHKIYTEAARLTDIIDTKNDTWYISFAIAFDGLLWTGDLRLHKALRKQGLYHTITTQEFSAILKGL